MILLLRIVLVITLYLSYIRKIRNPISILYTLKEVFSSHNFFFIGSITSMLISIEMFIIIGLLTDYYVLMVYLVIGIQSFYAIMSYLMDRKDITSKCDCYNYYSFSKYEFSSFVRAGVIYYISFLMIIS